MAGASSIFNYFLGLGTIIIATSIVSCVILFTLYYISTVMKKYTTLIFFLIVIFTFALIPVMWIFNGGILGGTTLYILLFSSMIAILLRGYTRIATIGCLLALTLALIILEYKNPSIIIGYDSDIDRYLDICFGLVVSLIVNISIFVIILNYYIKSQAEKQALINAIPDQMVILKRDGIVVDYKAATEDLSGSTAAFLGKSVLDIFPIDIATKIMQSTRMTISEGHIEIFEYQMLSYGNEEYYEARIIQRSEDDILAIIRNVTMRKRMENEMKYLSLHDALTKLYNRAFFEDELKRLEGVGEEQIGLIVCDVDGLKIINDTLGHAMGIPC